MSCHFHLLRKKDSNILRVVQPIWKPPGRIVMAKQCMLIHGEEKKALKQILKRERLCFRMDTWTSVQNLNYVSYGIFYCLELEISKENYEFVLFLIIRVRLLVEWLNNTC